MRTRHPPFTIRTFTLVCLAILCLVLVAGEARAGSCVVGAQAHYVVQGKVWRDTIVACRADAIVHHITVAALPQFLETWRIDPRRPGAGYALEPFRPVFGLGGSVPYLVRRSPPTLIPPSTRWSLLAVPLLR